MEIKADDLKNIQFIFTEDSFIIDETVLENKDNNFIKLFNKDRYRALYECAFINDPKGLDKSCNFLIYLASTFIRELSYKSELEVARENIIVEVSEEVLENILDRVPFSIGTEYINDDWIKRQFKALNEVFSNEIKKYTGTVKKYLEKHSQDLKIAERIYFHLVENEGDREWPFAFLATYATKDESGRIIHTPLKNALIEYKGERKKLLALLSCLNQVAQDVRLIADFMDSGEIYHPIRLKASEAYTLLKSIPVIEKSGIKCRVPNWWRRHYSSPTISVTVGENKTSLFGLETLLALKPALVVNGVALTASEINQLLKQEEGLTFLKGNWVEVNHSRLKELLEKIKDYDGTVTLKEALMRQYDREDKDDADLGVTISNGKWLNKMLRGLKDPRSIKDVKLPKSLNATLRPYQVDGYKWLSNLSELGFGACLADDMGLGKTIQVISLLEKMYEKNKDFKALLVVPASLLGNWQKELERFAPKLPFRIIHGKTKVLLEKDLEDDIFLTITTYGLISRIKAFSEIDWNLLIIDEAQAIKNPLTKQTKSIKALKADMHIALTGTPIENDLMNLWSIFDFLNKGLLGSYKDFKEYCKNIDVDTRYLSRLKGAISPFILRRLKSDKSIIADLPDKIEITDHVELSKRQIVMYHDEIVKTEDRILNSEGFERRGIVLGLITRLKEICNHPYQLIKDNNFIESDSGKFQMLRELCETIYEKRERVLIFTQYKEMCEPIAKFLKDIFRHEGLIIHGSIKPSERSKIVDKFNDKDHYIPFVVLSLRAAGTGLNLVSANHVIHFDRWWNPAVENQASDRAYRIGQTKKVFVHKLVTSGTIEEKIDTLITSKKELAENILAKGANNYIAELSNKELMDLLRLDI